VSASENQSPSFPGGDEQALIRRYKEANRKLQAMAKGLLKHQEDERRRIVNELHDEIAQILTGASLELRAAMRYPSQDKLVKRLESSIKAVEEVLERVSSLELDLRPMILDHFGLEPAVQWYTERRAGPAGLQAKFTSEPLDDRLDSEIETACFRVAQEAITNVTRHAYASNMGVELSKRGGELHVFIRDDGLGFEVGSARQKVIDAANGGLLRMESQVMLFGGGLEIKSQPDKGTEVHAWFPLERPGMPAEEMGA
jgi:signal transduction histidine kinase